MSKKPKRGEGDDLKLMDKTRPSGRPSSYTEEIGQEIFDRLSEGEALLQICREEGMPNRATVYRWSESNEAFRDKLVRAREAQAHFYFEKMLEVATDDKQDIFYDEEGSPVIDHARIQRHRLIVDTLKFCAAKLWPRTYGEKPAPEASEPQALTIRWLKSSDPRPDEPPAPPRLIAYQKPQLPGDLTERDWSTLMDLLELVKRTVPTNDERPPEEIFNVMRQSLLAHLAKPHDR